MKTHIDSVFFSNGDFVSVLLYSAKDNEYIRPIEHLPLMTDSAISSVEDIVGPLGDNYQLADTPMGELLRYKMAITFFMDSWVNKKYRSSVAKAVKNIVSDNLPSFMDARKLTWILFEVQSKVNITYFALLFTYFA